MSGAPSGIHAPAQDERFGFACGLSASPVMTRAHRHDDVEVAAPLGGDAVMEHGGRPYTIEAGLAAVFWASVPHRLAATHPAPGEEAADGAAARAVHVAWVTVPLTDVLAWTAVPGAFTAELLRGPLLTVAAPPDAERSMARWSAEIDADPTLRTAAAREVEALLLRASRTARRAASASAPSAGSRSEQLATAMAAFVSTHFREPLTIAAVAAGVHVHPSTATDAFRRHLGVGIAEYVAQCRTAEAQRLLIGTDATTSDVALRSGFGSVSAFYDRFVREVGEAPAAYRRRLRGGLT